MEQVGHSQVEVGPAAALWCWAASASIKKRGEGLLGAAAPTPPRPQSADEKPDEEHHDADEQQI
jgi:hypothetical protein